MTKLEEIAQAMFALLEQRNYSVVTDKFSPATWETTDEMTREIYINRARAAVGALREPSEAMLNAAMDASEDGYVDRGPYDAMIAAILTEQ